MHQLFLNEISQGCSYFEIDIIVLCCYLKTMNFLAFKLSLENIQIFQFVYIDVGWQISFMDSPTDSINSCENLFGRS